MILRMFDRKEFTFGRTYEAPISEVWAAWTRPELLRQWWGLSKATIPECELDLQVGGRIYIVMEAGQAMGRYQGTRWPMEGTFTRVEQQRRLAYQARSWTEGESTSSIEHVNTIELIADAGKTTVDLRVTIEEIGSGATAKAAVQGMKRTYKRQLERLEGLVVR